MSRSGVQKLRMSIARQLAKLAYGNIPYHRQHAQFMNGGWPGSRELYALLDAVSPNPLLYRHLNFSGNSSVLGNFMKSVKIPGRGL